MKFASRAGEKLEHALKTFDVSVAGLTCADFGANAGGFVDCLLQNGGRDGAQGGDGAKKVYAVETGYGILDWKLRNDPRVVVMERTNAMHVTLPEKMDLITIDTSWTTLEKVLPNALVNLNTSNGGKIIALIKPHYQAGPKDLRKGKLPAENIPLIIESLKQKINALGLEILAETESPIVGKEAGNKEFLLLLAAKQV